MTEQPKDNQELILIFARIYLFIKKYFLFLLIFTLAGSAYGYYNHSCSKYFYKKHLGLSSTVIHKDICMDIIKSLQPLIDEQNTTAIAKKLDISNNAAASLTRVDTSSYRNKLNLGFIIDLTFTDSSYADTLTSGLFYFLNHNDYYLRNKKTFIDDKQKLLMCINHKLGIQDSSSSFLTSSQITTKCASHTPQVFSSEEEIYLLEKKSELEKEIADSEITVAEETIVSVYTGTTLLKSVILYSACFCIAGILLILLIESIGQTRKHLKRVKTTTGAS